jgi:hypothetical protein
VKQEVDSGLEVEVEMEGKQEKEGINDKASAPLAKRRGAEGEEKVLTSPFVSSLHRPGYGAIYNLGPASLARYRILVSKKPIGTSGSKMPNAPGVRSGTSNSTIRRSFYERMTVIVDFYSSESLLQEADLATSGVQDPNFVLKLMERFSQLSGVEIPGIKGKEKEKKRDGKEKEEKEGKEKKKQAGEKKVSKVTRPPGAKKRRRKRKKQIMMKSNNNMKQMKKTLDSLNEIKDAIEGIIPKELIEVLTSMFGNISDPSDPRGIDLSKLEGLISQLSGGEKVEKTGEKEKVEQEEKQGQVQKEGTSADGSQTIPPPLSSTKRAETLAKLRRLRHLEKLRRERNRIRQEEQQEKEEKEQQEKEEEEQQEKEEKETQVEKERETQEKEEEETQVEKEEKEQQEKEEEEQQEKEEKETQEKEEEETQVEKEEEQQEKEEKETQVEKERETQEEKEGETHEGKKEI